MHEEIKICTACPLYKSRTHAVPGEGNWKARLMLIGEAPGAREDETGSPFCGRAGNHLDKLFAQLGFDRQATFITSTVKCRPPGNRTPHAEELDTCHELWLTEQIELIDPEIVVLLGGTAIRQLLEEDAPLKDMHGETREVNGRKFLMTYHPAAAMRFPDPDEGIQEDFRRLREMLDSE